MVLLMLIAVVRVDEERIGLEAPWGEAADFKENRRWRDG